MVSGARLTQLRGELEEAAGFLELAILNLYRALTLHRTGLGACVYAEAGNIAVCLARMNLDRAHVLAGVPL
jgi:hypothetical protein